MMVRIKTTTVIDGFELMGVDLTGNGLSSRGRITKQHKETHLILFNKWKFLIRKTIK